MSLQTQNKFFMQPRFYGFCFVWLLCLYPIGFGGNRPVPQFLFACLISLNGMALVFLSPMSLFSCTQLKKITGAIGIILAGLAYSACVISPLAWQITFPIFLKYVVYATVFLQAILCSRDKGFWQYFLKILTYSGLCYSFYGLYAMDTILFYDKVAYIGDVTSSFINRNHFAFFLNISVLACVACLIEKFNEDMPIRTHHQMIKRFFLMLQFLVNECAFFLICFGVIFLALLGTHSRGGFLQAILGIGLMGFYLMIGASNKLSFFEKMIPLILLCICVMGIYHLGGEGLLVRLYYLKASFVERLDVWKHGIEMIAAKLFWGHGMGTFENAFQSYRGLDASYFKRWDKLHQDYLEFIIEYGLILTGFLYGFMIYLFVKTIMQTKFFFKKYRLRTVFLSVMSLLFLIHSSYDFPGQMPAIACIMIALWGSHFGRLACFLKRV